MGQFNLLTYNNTKTLKGEASKYTTLILHLAPACKSGYNTCPHSTPGCRAACLSTRGWMAYPTHQAAQARRTKLLFENKKAFYALLCHDIDALLRKCEREGTRAAVRLNGTSDINFPRLFPQLFRKYPSVVFYDYTASTRRALSGAKPSNYYLTFSRKENTKDSTVKRVLSMGVNVAIPFATIPKTFLGYPVHCGDNSDLRFLDKKGIVGLTPKGRCRADKSGFLVR